MKKYGLSEIEGMSKDLGKEMGNGIDLLRMSEDQLVKEMEESIRKSDAGHTRPAAIVSKEMREKYAV